ncbi:MAG: hypothetical protein KBT88_10430 [Gammaproteobacteria bacterium]|nr:hypothetical protein [Gammaproteobacteria bacterium]MBQ0840191.1 hypothetical protein [Gammaproteobacteria bacterium]
MRVFVITTLLTCVFYPINLLAASEAKDGAKANPSCEESVDAADDMNFVDNIIECNEEAVIIYDQQSRQKFLTRKALPLKTYENQQRDGANSHIVEEPVHLPGTTFIIRAAYKLNAPQQALAPLHQQMATYCPRGWELDRQWSQPVAADYYLHFEFTCADLAE